MNTDKVTFVAGKGDSNYTSITVFAGVRGLHIEAEIDGQTVEYIVSWDDIDRARKIMPSHLADEIKQLEKVMREA